MVADLESLIPSACLAVGFILLIRAILKNQNPRARAAARAREAAAEAADPRIRGDQTLPSELRTRAAGAKPGAVKANATAKASAKAGASAKTDVG